MVGGMGGGGGRTGARPSSGCPATGPLQARGQHAPLGVAAPRGGGCAGRGRLLAGCHGGENGGSGSRGAGVGVRAMGVDPPLSAPRAFSPSPLRNPRNDFCFRPNALAPRNDAHCWRAGEP